MVHLPPQWSPHPPNFLPFNLLSFLIFIEIILNEVAGVSKNVYIQDFIDFKVILTRIEYMYNDRKVKECCKKALDRSRGRAGAQTVGVY